jgi:hypothetical protein
MTVGATDTFSQTRDEIISDALTNVGAIGPGQDATGVIRDHAARALGRIVKAIDAEGQFLWRMSELTFSTTATTASYALNATVFDVDEPINYMKSGETARVPLRPMSRDEYMALPDRTSAGRVPSRYYVEKSLSGAGRILCTMKLWPVPDTSSDTVTYVGALRAKDYTSGAITSDFPSNWVLCLVYGLTTELAPSYSQMEMAAMYRQLYEAEKNKQLNNDNEKQALIFVPFGGSY